MVGDKNTLKTELSCKHGDTNMNRWPPNVLFAAYNDFMRQVIRDMLRRCGVNEVVHRLSCEEVFAAARRRDDKKYQILILDGALPNALEAIKEPGEGLWPELKIILIFSGPTREEVLNAINAGAHDILTYPFTEEVLETRLHKLTSTAKTDTGEHVEKRIQKRTDALLQGLCGRADKLPSDGQINTGELVPWLHSRVLELTDQRQRPTRGLSDGLTDFSFFHVREDDPVCASLR